MAMTENLAHLSNTGHGVIHLVYEYLMIFTDWEYAQCWE